MADDCYFDRDGARFIPTEWTRGPWDPAAQHAGPPAALMARAAENLERDNNWQTSCFSMSILKPIPVKPLTVQAAIKRSGRSTQLIDVVLREEDTEVALASVWRIRKGQTQPTLPALVHRAPNDVNETAIIHPGWDPSYLSSMEWRYISGSFWKPGPSAVWTRARHPLVAGEATAPLGRLLLTADSGNGVSSVLPLDTALFINVELTVHPIGEARGEWICLDATTYVSTDGIGVARSTLWDEQGCVGFGAQSLLVAEHR